MKKNAGFDRGVHRSLQLKYSFLGILLVFLVACTGCQKKEEALVLASQAKEEVLELSDKAASLLGGEPREVRRLRELPLEETDGVHQEYYFQQLSEDEKRVYRELLAGILEFQEEILVSSEKDEILERAYQAILLDHAELFWVHGRGVVYKTLYRSYGKFQPKYGFTREEAEALERDLEEKAAGIVAGIDASASAYEKARYIYGYVIQNTDYREGTQDQNIAGALGEGGAVCAGYARAVQYLLEKLGVECIYASGDMKDSDQGHAWNIVNLDGNYYYLDATNGDQQDFLPAEEGEPQRVLYDYFCPFPEEYEALCQQSEEYEVPACTAVDYNSYVLGGNCFGTYETEQIRQYLLEQLEAGNQILSVKFVSEEDFALAREEWITQEEIRSVAMYYMELRGIEHVQYSYGLLEDLRTIYFMF